MNVSGKRQQTASATGLQAFYSEILHEELPDVVGRLIQLFQGTL